jgi:hypothetical protein
MSYMNVHRVGEGQSHLRLLKRETTPSSHGAVVSIAAGTAGRRKRVAPPRLGLLRLAPRLSVLGGSREPDWQIVAGGIGAAMTPGVEAEDAPSCA